MWERFSILGFERKRTRWQRTEMTVNCWEWLLANNQDRNGNIGLQLQETKCINLHVFEEEWSVRSDVGSSYETLSREPSYVIP
jgi:hypothetical protein